MNSEWQWVVVGIIVSVSAIDVARRVWVSLRRLGQGEGGCRRCTSGPTSTSPAVVSIARPKPIPKAELIASDHSE